MKHLLGHHARFDDVRLDAQSGEACHRCDRNHAGEYICRGLTVSPWTVTPTREMKSVLQPSVSALTYHTRTSLTKILLGPGIPSLAPNGAQSSLLSPLECVKDRSKVLSSFIGAC